MRHPDWLARLNELVESVADHQMAIGDFDCGIFSARGVDRMTGSNWEEDLRALYSSPRSALEWLDNAGGMEAAVTARLGKPQKWWRAQRGDVCLLPGEGERHVLGLCMGETIAALGLDGVRYVPLDAAIAIWKVG